MVAIGDVELCVEDFGDVPGDPTILLIAGAAAAMDVVGPRPRAGSSPRQRVAGWCATTTATRAGPPPAPWAHPTTTATRSTATAWGWSRPSGRRSTSSGSPQVGGIAQGVALRRPELVASLALIATASVGGVDWSTVPGPVAELAAQLDPPPEPDWSDREAVIDSMIDDQRAHAGTIAVDEERARTLAGQVYDRSIDVAAAANHWIAIVREGEAGADEPPLDIHDLVEYRPWWCTAPTTRCSRSRTARRSPRRSPMPGCS